MTHWKNELFKIWYSRLHLLIAMISFLLLPLFVVIVSRLQQLKGGLEEAQMISAIAYTTIAYAQAMFFIPVWIVSMVGREIQSAHASTVSSITSREHYFSSKITYCLITCVFFSSVGTLGFLAAAAVCGILPKVTFGFVAGHLVQQFVAHITFCSILLLIVFVVKNPAIAFVVYLVWNFAEGLAFTVVNGLYEIRAWWLPLHLLRTLYVTDGDPQAANFHNPIFSGNFLFVSPIMFAAFVTVLTKEIFLRSDLPVLSD